MALSAMAARDLTKLDVELHMGSIVIPGHPDILVNGEHDEPG